jgi:predicted DNA-binding protein (MmcQ/YjbR family)
MRAAEVFMAARHSNPHATPKGAQLATFSRGFIAKSCSFQNFGGAKDGNLGGYEPTRTTALRHQLATVYARAMPARKVPSHPIKALAAADAALVERLRKLCMMLPEANEKLSHGEPTWFAGKGKVFAMLDNHHHGSSHLAVWLPQPPGVQQSLIEADAERFFRPPYVGPSGWVGVVLETKPDWKLVAGLIRDSFLHVATKKLSAQLA